MGDSGESKLDWWICSCLCVESNAGQLAQGVMCFSVRGAAMVSPSADEKSLCKLVVQTRRVCHEFDSEGN